MGAVASGTAGLADCARWPEGDGWMDCVSRRKNSTRISRGFGLWPTTGSSYSFDDSLPDNVKVAAVAVSNQSFEAPKLPLADSPSTTISACVNASGRRTKLLDQGAVDHYTDIQ